MNKLPIAKRTQILSLLCEGTSMRAVSRLADVSINTVSKLLVDAGRLCAAFHDDQVRGVKARRVQVDEIWTRWRWRPSRFTYADMDVFPAGAWTGVAAVVGNAVAGAAKPAEFLDIEVQQVAGMRMFVAANGRRRVEGGQSLESGAAEDATDGGGRHMHRGGDVGATPAAPAQRHDLGRDRCRQYPGLAVWPRAAVAQSVRTLGLIADHPLAHRAGTDPDGDGHRGGGLARPAPAGRWRLDSAASTWHSYGCPLGPPSGKRWRNTISFLGRGRVNNLLKDHS